MFLSLLLLIGYPAADGVDGDEPSSTVACDVIQQDIALRTNRPRGIRFECPDGFQGSEELQAYVDGLAAQIDFDLGRRRRFVDVGQFRFTRGPDGAWRAADQKPVIRAMVMAPMDAARYQTEAICAVAARINDRGLVDGDPDIACAYSHDDVPAFVTDQIVGRLGRLRKTRDGCQTWRRIVSQRGLICGCKFTFQRGPDCHRWEPCRMNRRFQIFAPSSKAEKC